LAQQDSGHDEWVNAWAETAQAAPMPKAEPFVAAPVVLQHVAQPISISPDQLMRDIAEIERVRDALAAQPQPVFAKGRTQALTAPARTTDAVPVVIGGILALVMLTVFGAAAAMTKLVR
jgi:hypothetical protein